MSNYLTTRDKAKILYLYTCKGMVVSSSAYQDIIDTCGFSPSMAGEIYTYMKSVGVNKNNNNGNYQRGKDCGCFRPNVYGMEITEEMMYEFVRSGHHDIHTYFESKKRRMGQRRQTQARPNIPSQTTQTNTYFEDYEQRNYNNYNQYFDTADESGLNLNNDGDMPVRGYLFMMAMYFVAAFLFLNFAERFLFKAIGILFAIMGVMVVYLMIKDLLKR